MGFIQSYFRLPRYQKIVIGLLGITVGLCGPSVMDYLFLADASSSAKTEEKTFSTGGNSDL